MGEKSLCGGKHRKNPTVTKKKKGGSSFMGE